MRLVRFEDESGGFAVDLHPLITVISGLPAHVRERLVHGLAALPRGTDPGGRGALEVHGIYLDLNRESLDLLELGQDLDVVLRSSDLPGAEAHEPDAGAATEPVPDAAELAEIRRRVEEQEDAYENAERAVEVYRAQLAEVEAERAGLEVEVAEARAGLDSFASAGLKVAREELAELIARRAGDAPATGLLDARADDSADADSADADHDSDDDADDDAGQAERAAESAAELARIEERLTFLISESDRLKRRIKGLQAIDTTGVQAAYDELLRVAPGDADADADADEIADAADDDADVEVVEEIEDVAPAAESEAEPELEAVAEPDAADAVEDVEDELHPAAVELIERWEELAERRARLEERLGRPSDLEVARDAAREALLLAEQHLRAPMLDDAAVAELENVHDEIFELEGRTSRFGAGKIRRKLESLRKRQDELLEQLGFDSWSSYIMGIATITVDPAHREAVARAQAEYDAANEAVQQAASRPGLPDPEIAAIERDRAMLVGSTERLLGEPLSDDPVAQLQAFRVTPFVPAAEPVAEPTRPESARPEPAVALEPAVAPEPAPEPEATVAPAPPADAPASAADVDRAAAAVRAAIAATGATLPDRELDTEEIRALAAGWLETMSGLPEVVAEAVAERDAIEAEIAELGVRFETLQAAVPAEPTRAARRRARNGGSTTAASAAGAATEAVAFAEDVADDDRHLDDPRFDDDPEVLDARRRLADARARLRAHDEAAAAVAALERHHQRIDARLQELREAIDEQEPHLASLREHRAAARNRLRRAEAANAEAEAARRDARARASEQELVGGSAGAEAVEWYVLARLAQQRSVSFVGSVPLVIDDAFVNWPIEALGDVFSRLERMGEVIQIVYLTDDPEVGDWARGLGPDRALVLDMRVA